MENEVIIEYLLAAVLIIIPLVLIYLEFLDYKKRKKETKDSLSEKNKIYLDRIEKVNIKEPITSLDDVDLIARDFFIDLFKVESFPGYSQLQKEFEKEGKKNEKLFCKIMDKFLYEEKKPQKKQINKLKEVFKKIIINNDLPEKDKKK